MTRGTKGTGHGTGGGWSGADPGAAAVVSICELGPLAIRRADAEQPVRGDRARLVLALLSLNRRGGLSLDQLVDTIWPGSDRPSTARQSLSNIVGRLRTALGPDSITTVDGRYRLADDIGSDRQCFLDLLNDVESLVERRLWAESVDRAGDLDRLWRGEPWTDVTGLDPDLDPIEEDRRFLEMRRRRHDALRARALTETARPGEAIEVYRHLIGADPWNEAHRSGLVTALRDAGERTEAMRALAEARATLAEAGMTPGPTLAELEAQLLADGSDRPGRPEAEPDPGTASTAASTTASTPTPGSAAGPPSEQTPATLPRYRDDFVGRESELRLIEELLSEAGLVSLVGPGGVGKTRLAVEGSQTSEFDHRFFVDLTSSSDPSRVASVVAEIVGSRDQSAVGLAGDMARRFADQRVLLVVDNCEHVLDAAADLIDQVLAGFPSVTVLATSREALDVRGERVLPLAPLPTGGGAELGPAAHLLATRARSANPRVDVLAEPEVAARICALVDGLPLAIELAAARLRTLSPSELADRLDGRLSLLAARRGRSQRHRTMEAVVEWSYDLLDPMERLAFERLSVFVGGFTAAAAEAVVADGELPAGEVFDLIVRLAERSLLVTDTSSSKTQRFRQLETLRQVALTRHAETQQGDGDPVAERHLEWAVDEADRVQRAMRTPAQDASLGSVVADHDNLRAARHLAWSTGRPTEALRITTAVPLDDHRSRRVHLSSLLDQATDAPASLVTHATYTLATVDFELGDFPAALERAARAGRGYRDLGERGQEAYAQLIEAMASWGTSEHRTAVEPLLDSAMATFTLLGDEMGQGYIGFMWALWLAHQGDDTAKALALADRAHQRLAGVDTPFGVAHAEEARAHALSAGDAPLSVSMVPAASAVAQLHRLSNWSCMAHAVDTVAMVVARSGHHSQAAVLLGAAEQLREESQAAAKPWEAEAATAANEALDRAEPGIEADLDLHRGRGRLLRPDEILAMIDDLATVEP